MYEKTILYLTYHSYDGLYYRMDIINFKNTLIMDNDILNKHSPGKLFLAGNKSYAPQVVADNGEEMQYNMKTICTPYGYNDSERIGNAERIVKTWNEYDKLKKDNKLLLDHLKAVTYEYEVALKLIAEVGSFTFLPDQNNLIINSKKVIKNCEL